MSLHKFLILAYIIRGEAINSYLGVRIYCKLHVGNVYLHQSPSANIVCILCGLVLSKGSIEQGMRTFGLGRYTVTGEDSLYCCNCNMTNWTRRSRSFRQTRQFYINHRYEMLVGWGYGTSKDDVSSHEFSGTPIVQFSCPGTHNVPGMINPCYYMHDTIHDRDVSIQGQFLSGTRGPTQFGWRYIASGRPVTPLFV